MIVIAKLALNVKKSMHHVLHCISKVYCVRQLTSFSGFAIQRHGNLVGDIFKSFEKLNLDIVGVNDKIVAVAVRAEIPLC